MMFKDPTIRYDVPEFLTNNTEYQFVYPKLL